MIPLVALLALALGLALLVGCVALVARERARRARLQLGIGRRTERLMWERLDWVAGRPAAIREQLDEPAGAGPDGHLAVDARSSAAPAQVAADADADSTNLSPRRRLWRDTSAVVFVGALALFVYSFAATPRPAPTGAVLAATSSPAVSPVEGVSEVPSPTSATTPAPTRSAPPSANPSISPGPSAAATSTPTPKLSPRPTPRPTPRSAPQPTLRPTAAPAPLPSPSSNPSPVVITPPPAPTPS